jgi:formate dehydrogenase subunit delta
MKMTDSHRLVKMANDIGAFFEAMPDREQAARDMANHINRFWEPRMKKGLFDYIQQHGDAELKEVARAAFKEVTH